MRNWFERLSNEIKSHRFIYLVLATTFIGGLFIRSYRTDQLLNFYYDQGRDALKVWDFWHHGDLMLIGPTTGIAGIFRGPFYFYLIAPFYLLSGGSPILPAYMLATISMIAVLLAYYLGWKIHSRIAGLIVAIISSFSYFIMTAGRWLSNPTPMLLLSMILVWSMLVIANEKDKKSSKSGWSWVVVSLVSGLSLWHFGSSGELFYFPALIIFFLWQLGIFDRQKRKKWRMRLPRWKYMIISACAFLFTMAPLIVFDFLSDHLQSRNIAKFVFEDESFRVDFYTVFQERLFYFYNTFCSNIFHGLGSQERYLLLIAAVLFIIFLPKLIKNDGFKILLILLISPIVGMLFFQGNYGNIYGYYMTGYYMIFLLVFAIVLAQAWKHLPGKIYVLIFFYIFFSSNIPVIQMRAEVDTSNPQSIVFANQIDAVEWIFEDADGRDFNVDVYVPPVIPYAYDYLFTWLGSTKYNNVPMVDQIDLLYTLAEDDPPHPERLQAWEDRQADIGAVEETEEFGGITVKRRKRIEYE